MTNAILPVFPRARLRLTPIPAPFFSELLPQIDHLGELKVTLYAFWFLDRQEGSGALSRARHDFAADEALAAADWMPHAWTPALRTRRRTRGNAAAARCPVKAAARKAASYFLNSPRGRAALQALAAGEWSPDESSHRAGTLEVERPNIFRLYEAKYRPADPADRRNPARSRETSTRPSGSKKPFKMAVRKKRPPWRYIEAILRLLAGGRS